MAQRQGRPWFLLLNRSGYGAVSHTFAVKPKLRLVTVAVIGVRNKASRRQANQEEGTLLPKSEYMPITGTFVSCLPGDTGINNWGLREWEKEFALYRAIGIDTIVIIRSEVESDGVRWSGLDPRSTTWAEDPDLISMFFRLSEEHGIKLYLGGTENLDILYKGYWKQEVEESIVFYEKMLERFNDYACFHGLYYSVEALPWHFNFRDIAIGVAEAAQKLAPEKKKLFSPTMYPLTSDLRTPYSLEDFERIYGEMLLGMSGNLDYCAWQDKYFRPNCAMGEIRKTSLDAWYAVAKRITEGAGMAFWANVETFQRGATGAAPWDFRQIDYRNLAPKLQTAARFATKAITFEFSTCLSPRAEWGSTAFLLERYLEMVGLDPALART